ncbi:hypothetical protein HK096_009830, partial [Nowakowskiella sp. JEL0078]
SKKLEILGAVVDMYVQHGQAHECIQALKAHLDLTAPSTASLNGLELIVPAEYSDWWFARMGGAKVMRGEWEEAEMFLRKCCTKIMSEHLAAGIEVARWYLGTGSRDSNSREKIEALTDLCEIYERFGRTSELVFTAFKAMNTSSLESSNCALQAKILTFCGFALILLSKKCFLGIGSRLFKKSGTRLILDAQCMARSLNPDLVDPIIYLYFFLVKWKRLGTSNNNITEAIDLMVESSSQNQSRLNQALFCKAYYLCMLHGDSKIGIEIGMKLLKYANSHQDDEHIDTTGRIFQSPLAAKAYCLLSWAEIIGKNLEAAISYLRELEKILNPVTKALLRQKLKHRQVIPDPDHGAGFLCQCSLIYFMYLTKQDPEKIKQRIKFVLEHSVDGKFS